MGQGMGIGCRNGKVPLVPGDDSIISGSTTITTTTTKLLTMKECSDKKVPLVKMP